MSVYYSFQHPSYTPQAMDPTHRVPDALFKPTLEAQMRDQMNSPTYELTPTCTMPPPCRTWIQFKPELSECPTTFVHWNNVLTNTSLSRPNTKYPQDLPMNQKQISHPSVAPSSGAVVGNVPSTYVDLEIGQKDSRIWVADLNPVHYNRGLISSAEWWPEATKPHIRNRQLFAQYLQSTMYKKSSPNEKRIDRVEDSYAVMRHKFGPNGIQYTSF